jgi:putative flippase GtrA
MQRGAGFNINDYVNDTYEKHRAFIRFAIVGCINTGVDFITFSVFNSILGFDKLICQVLGYSAGIINSFVFNKLWTFEDRSESLNTAKQALRFAVVNGFSLGLSLLGLKYLNENYGLNIYISKLAVTVAAQAVNYVGYKLWVFRSGNFA